MLRTTGFVFIACCALSALTLADARKSKPSATVSPAGEFGATTTTTTASTTTMPPKTTTTASTTKASTTTTTASTTKASTTTTTASTTKASTTTTTASTTTTTASTTKAPTNTTTASTTKASTTTTTASTTTTTASTTKAPTNTTTTAKTTTTPKTTTAPTTTAPPPPTSTVGDYNVTKKNETCLKAHMALQIRLVSAKANGSFTVQPKETNATGSCDENRVTLNLTFSQGFINFNFTRNITNNTVYMDAVAFSLNYPLGLLAGVYSVRNASVHLFPTKVGHSYSCRNDSLYMGNGLYLDVSKDKLQAFNLTKNDFGTPDPCPADQPDYRVAIGVGVTLLVLIVVVVVAYLLSRRRRVAGYQSL